MHKKLTFLFLTMILVVSFQLNVFASDIMSVNYLIENAKALDGTQVLIQGEAIGESMQRRNYSWVNVKDSTNAIGIWVKNDDRLVITYFGNYNNIGDSIKITGIFHKACIEHGGEPDIHCEKLLIEKKGYTDIKKVSYEKVILSITLLIVLFISGFAVYNFILRKKS